MKGVYFSRYLLWLVSLTSIVFGRNALSQHLNTYSIFKVNQLNIGKDVTIGKYVLAYMKVDHVITIRPANPPQRLDITLEWINRKNHSDLKILGHWNKNSRHELLIGMEHARKNLLASNSGQGKLILLSKKRPNVLSIPLKENDYVLIQPQKKQFKHIAQQIRIVISSNMAFQIER